MSSYQHVFHTTIKEGKYEAYKNYHDNIFPEVAAGLRKNGVNLLAIYRLPGTRTLVMTIVTAWKVDDLSTILGPGTKYRENPKCKEWEELMDSDFHGGWTKMERIHASDIDWKRALDL